MDQVEKRKTAPFALLTCVEQTFFFRLRSFLCHRNALLRFLRGRRRLALGLLRFVRLRLLRRQFTIDFGFAVVSFGDVVATAAVLILFAFGGSSITAMKKAILRLGSLQTQTHTEAHCAFAEKRFDCEALRRMLRKVKGRPAHRQKANMAMSRTFSRPCLHVAFCGRGLGGGCRERF